MTEVYKRTVFLCLFIGLLGITNAYCLTIPGAGGIQYSADHGLARLVKLVSQENGSYLLENVRWGIKSRDLDKIAVEEREFYWKRATVKPDLVDKVYFILKRFKPKFLAGHGYALITFKKNGFLGQSGFNPEGLVISFEIFKKEGIKLKDLDFVRDATHKVYEIAPIVATWEDYVASECDLAKNKLSAYELNFNQRQKVQFVHEILNLSLSRPEVEYYHTLKNSCVTKQLGAINSVLPKKKKISPKILNTKILNVNAFIPTFIPKAYVRKGVMTLLKTKITPENYFAPLKSLLK